MQTKKFKTVVNCFLVSVIIFISTCKPPSQTELTELDKQYIADLTNDVQDGWNRGDRESYVNRFSKDALYMPPNMETVVGKDDIRNFVNSFPQIKLHYEVAEIMGSASYAYVRGAFEVTDSTDALVDKGKFLSVWKKFPDEKWLLTHDIFSSDLPLPTAEEY